MSKKEISTDKELRSFGLLVGSILAAVGLWPSLIRGEDPRVWALLPAGCLIILALIRPQFLGSVHRAWMALGHILAWINTKIILSVIFYAVISPVGIVMRMLGKAPMRSQFDPQATTYRVMRSPRPASHMARQF